MAVVPIPSASLTPTPEQSRAFCAQLEAGDILYFPQSPVPLTANDTSFLLGQHQADTSLHKTIASNPATQRCSGFDAKTPRPAPVERLQRIMRAYSSAVVQFLTSFLAPYQQH